MGLDCGWQWDAKAGIDMDLSECTAVRVLNEYGPECCWRYASGGIKRDNRRGVNGWYDHKAGKWGSARWRRYQSDACGGHERTAWDVGQFGYLDRAANLIRPEQYGGSDECIVSASFLHIAKWSGKLFSGLRIDSARGDSIINNNRCERQRVHDSLPSGKLRCESSGFYSCGFQCESGIKRGYGQLRGNRGNGGS